MSELIWVGNTLLPRWVVFSSVLAAVFLPYLIAGIISGIRSKTEGKS